ncbi:DUF5615 family PIN-like protein [Hyphomonas sp.]|uniref:DUF5615 family PIN-like protein n=1 Tax=Hyphomonas sp. TaxID=87 RepID=UPI00391C1F65
MSFLIDENLSWRLVRMLEEDFPGCRHVTACGLERADDAAVWAFARANALAILSKDDDLLALVEARGAPPKLVWLRMGNVSTGEIAGAIRLNAELIQSFLSGADAVLEIP